MNCKIPTPIYRFLHLDNLRIYLKREALYAPNITLNDGLIYKTIHKENIQHRRAITPIPCGRRGVIHDYVPFYLGPRSPMLLSAINDPANEFIQEDIIYIVCLAQPIVEKGYDIVFSDGHGLIKTTKWYASLSDLEKLNWDIIYATTWNNTNELPDRKRCKQAEFLIHEKCPWLLVEAIAVLNLQAKQRVESILQEFETRLSVPVIMRPKWYY